MNIGVLTVTLGCDTSGLARASAAMKTFEKNTVTSLNTMSQKLRTFGYLASATLTYPIVMAGKSAMKMASDFEFSIQKVVGLAGVAQEAVNGWSDELLKMAPQVAKTPQELAEALYYIASSGIKGAEALDVLRVSAMAATAGLGETKDVANVITSALNAYRGTGLTAAYATDVLVAGVREGKGEASQFSTALGQIIPIAANLGVSFDQIVGGMAAITLTGSSAANAAVYLKGVFNALITANEQGKKVLEGTNISYAELRRILAEQGLVALMQKFVDIEKEFGSEALKDVLPNIRAITAEMSFAGKNFEYNTKLMKKVENSTGSLGKAFDAVSQTIKVRYDQAISAANVSMIALGKSLAEVLLPMLEKLVGWLEKLTKWFDSLSEAQKRHVIVIALIVAALGPLSLILSVIGYAVSGLITVVSKFTRVLAVLQGVAVKSPWVLLLAAVAGLVTWLISLRKNAIEVAKENVKLNDSLVKVEGTMKRISDLTQADYGKMTPSQLFAERDKANQTYMAAKKNLKYAYGEAGIPEEYYAPTGKTGGWRWSAFINQNITAAQEAKDQYEALNDAITTWADNFGKGITKDVVPGTVKIDEQAEALKRLNQEYNDIMKNIYKYTEAERQNLYIGTTGVAKQVSIPKTIKTGEYGFMPSLENIKATDEALQQMKTIASTLANVFEDMFMSIGEGFKSMVEGILQSLRRLIAQVLARAMVFVLLSIISGGTSNLAVAAKELMGGSFWKFMLKPLGRAMAGGGIVPPGYPNDTYPARLSSGEMVVPPGQIGGLAAQSIHITVDGRISGRDLVLALRRANISN